MVSRDEAQISRRNAIKKAAVATGAVAWSVPTVQILTMGGAGASDHKVRIGSLPPCEGTGKENRPTSWTFTYWTGRSCADSVLTDSAVQTVCTPPATTCDGDVYVSVISGNATGFNPVTIASGDSFTVLEGGDANGDFTIELRAGGVDGDVCQTLTPHTSCSDFVYGLKPGAVLGSLTLTNWDF